MDFELSRPRFKSLLLKVCGLGNDFDVSVFQFPQCDMGIMTFTLQHHQDARVHTHTHMDA